MTAKASIISAIQTKVGNNYSIYRIGLAHDLAERKMYWRDTEKQSVTYSSNWTADSLSDAQDIESHFIRKGMQGGVGGNLKTNQTVFVYVV